MWSRMCRITPRRWARPAWPVGVASLSGHVTEIRALGLPEEVLDKMFYRNAARIFGLEQ